jgi:hypothetical protein
MSFSGIEAIIEQCTTALSAIDVPSSMINSARLASRRPDW